MKFNQIEVKNIEGAVEIVDIAKPVGNYLYSNGRDIAICELGKQIYKGEDVELTDEVKAMISAMLQDYPYVLKEAIESAMGVKTETPNTELN